MTDDEELYLSDIFTGRFGRVHFEKYKYGGHFKGLACYDFAAFDNGWLIKKIPALMKMMKLAREGELSKYWKTCTHIPSTDGPMLCMYLGADFCIVKHFGYATHAPVTNNKAEIERIYSAKPHELTEDEITYLINKTNSGGTQ